MAHEQDAEGDSRPPWQQEVLDSEWVLALAALLFFLLSYVVLGLIDLLTISSG